MVARIARRRGIAGAFLLATLAASLAPSDPAALARALREAAGSLVSVIVQERAPASDESEHLVERLGGRLGRALPIVDGFSAEVPAAVLGTLAASPTVRWITPNRPVAFQHGTPPSDGGPTHVYDEVIGADRMWAAGYTGAGVTAAVIDTGISPVADLAGRVVPVTDEITGTTDSCVNFSGEAGCQDSFGHGTFVAGVLAGDGASSGGAYRGVAPGARLVSVKLSGRDGAADVSALLAAIQWVVAHRDAYGIRVLNLSVGSDSPQPYEVDPLNYAVERAWDAGIVVVVAASNRGPNPVTVTKPGDDPWVITVGAIDDRGTADSSDDLMPNFSARGPTLANALDKPDLVAPGARLVSLGAPGSAIEQAFPHPIGSGYRRGSGTSFATPAVAGAVALMLEHDPALVPDRVKFALMSTARPTASGDRFAVGAGLMDVHAAATGAPGGLANQGLGRSDGSGSLDASRGSLRFTASDTGLLIEGNLTQQLALFDQIGYTTTGWTGASWHGASWHGASWHGASWHGASWHGASWHGASWHGVQDDGQSYGEPWLGSALYGAWE